MGVQTEFIADPANTPDPTPAPTAAPTDAPIAAPTVNPTPSNFVFTKDGTVSSVSGNSFSFNTTFDFTYPLVVISSCSDTRNQFDSTLTLKDLSTGMAVATDSDSCPRNSLQAEIVTNNLPAGAYEITIDGLNGAASGDQIWEVDVLATFGNTNTPTMSPTKKPTESVSERGSGSGSESGSGSGSESGSGSGSDSSDDAMSLFAAAHDVQKEEQAVIGDVVEDGTEPEFQLHLSDSVWINVWLIFAAFLLVNCVCFAIYFKRSKANNL